MNLIKLEELDNKQVLKLDTLIDEHKRLIEECNALKDKLPQILIEKGQEEADNAANDLNKKLLLADAQRTVIQKYEKAGCVYYTDEDVIEGYESFVKEHNTKFDKLHDRYLGLFDEAFKLYKQMIDLRRGAFEAKERYKDKLVDKTRIGKCTHLATLDLSHRVSKDLVANFITYYGDPRNVDAHIRSNEDKLVFNIEAD